MLSSLLFSMFSKKECVNNQAKHLVFMDVGGITECLDAYRNNPVKKRKLIQQNEGSSKK